MIVMPTKLDNTLPTNNIENFILHITSILLGTHPLFLTNEKHDHCDYNAANQIFSFCTKSKLIALEFSCIIDKSNDEYLRKISPNLHPDWTRNISTLIKKSIKTLNISYAPTQI
jgi:hypothetical protein